MGRLEGKTALITGAARGIGARIAQNFSEEGAMVIINDLNIDAAQTTADHLGGCAFACDVSDPQAVDAMFEQVGRQFESLDVLVNNAGISGLEGDDDAQNRLLESYSEDSAEPQLPILGLTRSLARELAPHKVRVNALAPGHIYTDMISSLEGMHPALVAQTPLGNLGDTDDIAWAAVYLASNEAKFVAGQTLSPNGGWHMSQ